MLPLRIVSFKFRPMHVMHVHPRAYACINNKKSLVNITWPELGKQNTQAKKVYSGFHAVVPDWRCWIPDFYSVELGLQIPIVLAGFRIPTAEFRIPQGKVSQILDSKNSNFPDSRIQITYTRQIFGLSMKKLKLMSSTAKILVHLS